MKILVTGVTGYIGGDAFYEIANAHPEYDFTCIVRNSDKGAQVASLFPQVRLVYCDLDDAGILEDEARKADIVLNCASADREGAAKAVIRGLTMERNGRPGYIIHTSGTGVLMYKDLEPILNKGPNTLGEAAEKIYDDWDGIAEVTSLPDYAPHRTVDKLVINGGNNSELKTAVVCPPTIYGVGRGPGNVRGHQLYELARCTLEKQHGLQIGAGKTLWTNVHVHDMSKCYLKLVEAAVEGGDSATWGAEGYYFTENGEHVWGEVSKKVALEAKKQGLISDDAVVSISAEEGDRLTKRGSLLWGANSRCRAIRARKLLGWTPVERSLVDEIPDAVRSEARKIGVTTGHAAKIAG